MRIAFCNLFDLEMKKARRGGPFRLGCLGSALAVQLLGALLGAPTDAEVDGVKGQILRALVSARLAKQLGGLQVAGGGKTGADGVEHGVGWALEGQTDR